LGLLGLRLDRLFTLFNDQSGELAGEVAGTVASEPVLRAVFELKDHLAQVGHKANVGDVGQGEAPGAIGADAKGARLKAELQAVEGDHSRHRP